ncbi:hypothetical protein J6590_034800 [Homalodisca vitripennis]|nr:hypothetical protein J6590_034800 [Homalodisca vitripennis]
MVYLLLPRLPGGDNGIVEMCVGVALSLVGEIAAIAGVERTRRVVVACTFIATTCVQDNLYSQSQGVGLSLRRVFMYTRVLFVAYVYKQCVGAKSQVSTNRPIIDGGQLTAAEIQQ